MSTYCQATRDERLQIHTLAREGKPVKEIAEQFSFTPYRVYYILKQPVTPRKRKGRPPIFDAEKRQQLVQHVTASSENRQTEYFRLPPEVSLHASERTIRRALGLEGFHRRVMRRKPYLSKKNREKRLLFAQCYADWDVEDWHEVLWTDESSMQCLGLSTQVYFFIIFFCKL